VHYGIGPNNAQIACPAKNLNQKCPICAERNANGISRGGDGERKRDPLMPTRRVAVWMIDKHEEEKGPMIWIMAQTLDRDIVKCSRDPDTGKQYCIDHPYEGYNVSFEKVEKGGGPQNIEYSGIQISRKVSSVQEEILEYVENNPLPDCFVWQDYETIVALYEGAPVESKSSRTQPSSRQTQEEDEVPPPRNADDYGSRRAEAAGQGGNSGKRWTPPNSEDKRQNRHDEPEPDPIPSRRPNMGGGGAAAEPERTPPPRDTASTASALRDRFKARKAS
jgi:hypothetical protein